MKKLRLSFLLTLTTLSIFTACKDDNTDVTPTPNPVDETEVIVTDNITSDVTWSNDKVYILAGRIAVEANATLTIEAGTIIKGQAGTGVNATALLIARDAKLQAEGTATAPIIFTSVADEIMPADVAAGNFESPNLDPNINGLWGGVLVCGNATISASASPLQIEGIPTTDVNGLYGGNNDADNSGVLRYISIRHGGSNIGDGNEINGLTLAGVGSGTVVDNIEVVANQDDGIEWFGGTVSVTNVVVWNAGDDAIDTDQAWAGTLSNFVVVSPAGHCFELDGPEGTYAAGHVIENGSIIANYDGGTSEDLINVDDNSIVTLRNLYFTAIEPGQQINRVTAAEVVFENIQFDVPAADLADYVNGAVPAGVTAGGSSQASIEGFSWTWAAKASVFNGL